MAQSQEILHHFRNISPETPWLLSVEFIFVECSLMIGENTPY